MKGSRKGAFFLYGRYVFRFLGMMFARFPGRGVRVTEETLR